MSTLSQRRKTALAADAALVRALYAAACTRFGDDAVQRDITLLWTMRAMQAMDGTLPFEETASRTLKEVLYVAREVCGLGTPPPPRQESCLPSRTAC